MVFGGIWQLALLSGVYESIAAYRFLNALTVFRARINIARAAVVAVCAGWILDTTRALFARNIRTTRLVTAAFSRCETIAFGGGSAARRICIAQCIFQPAISITVVLEEILSVLITGVQELIWGYLVAAWVSAAQLKAVVHPLIARAVLCAQLIGGVLEAAVVVAFPPQAVPEAHLVASCCDSHQQHQHDTANSQNR
jgi:hypothetical protein